MVFKWNIVPNISTFLPKVRAATAGQSGGVVTVARGWMDDVPGGMVVREGGDGYGGSAVRSWGAVGCAGTDGRRGLDEVDVT